MGAHGFKVGDYVRHDRDGYDPESGTYIEGTVTIATSNEVRVKVESSTSPFFRVGADYILWPDAEDDDFERLRRLSTPFKLKERDRVKNLRTGRVGYVHESITVKPGKLIVIPAEDLGASMSFADYQSAPLASALEAYEAEHPGTYDIVTKGAPW